MSIPTGEGEFQSSWRIWTDASTLTRFDTRSVIAETALRIIPMLNMLSGYDASPKRMDCQERVSLWPQRQGRSQSGSGIAVQHQPVRANFPALEPVEEAHPQKVGLHLAARHDERRHGSLDKLPDCEPVERQASGARSPAGGLDIDIVVQ